MDITKPSKYAENRINKGLMKPNVYSPFEKTKGLKVA